jgi:hypothetical protein
MKRPYLKLLQLLVAVFLLSCDSDDESTPGLKGIVINSSRLPVIGANVFLFDDTGDFHQTTTADDGRFSFTQMAPGEYILKVQSTEANGSFMELQKNVTIASTESDQTLELPVGVTLFEPETIADHSVEVKWNKSGLDNFLEYKLYRHSTSGLDETTGTLVHVATSVNDTVFNDTELLDKETYFYRVFVRNTFGLYGGSNIIQVTTSQGNHVTNGDFELGLEAWHLFTPDPCVELAQDPTSPAGSAVLKAEIADAQKANISSEIYQTINHTGLVEGETYTLSFWAKAESLPGTSVLYVYLQSNGDWVHHVSIKLDSNSPNEWTQYSKDFIAADAQNPYSLFVYGEPNVPWEGQLLRVYVDDIRLSRK